MRIPSFTLPLILILAAALTGQQAGSAVGQFQSLRDKVRQARSSKDWHANVERARELAEFLNESPGSLIEVARAEVHAGDLDGASRSVQQFVHMGQVTDLLKTSDEFAPLRNTASFPEILSRMKENRSPISLASTEFQLPEAAVLAEDVDYDPHEKRFFLTSVREKKIIAADATGVIHDFAKSPDDWPMLAIKIDSPHGVLWATEVALKGFVFAPEADWGRSAVLRYDLKTAKLLKRIEGPRGGALGDMALNANGDAIVSDGEGGGIYSVLANGDQLERLDAGDFLSPQTPAMHPDGKHVFVPDYLRGIGLLDIGTKHVRWLSTEGRFALDGIDGLYFDRGKLIAVQNGSSPERVVVFTLDATLSRVTAETVIERATETLGDPTHGVVVDQKFYYIANSGWDAIDEHGSLKSGAKQSAAFIMSTQLNAK
jgi:sugar lactone lactonase YvrE